MSEKIKKNIAESLYQKLKNLATHEKRPFDQILRYYAIERFLYRLSISSYAPKFFLKGGLLLMAWDTKNHRATMDIDFLAKAPNNVEYLRKMIETVSQIKGENDAIRFDIQNLTLKIAQNNGKYPGINAAFLAHLFSADIHISIDVGFKDAIIPKAEKIKYPTLLDTPPFVLNAYTLETVFAEKFEAIVKLRDINTRLKDFYDIWTLSQLKEINSDTLKIAIQKVFDNRGTRLEIPIAFSEKFCENPQNIRRWELFSNRAPKSVPNLKTVVAEISAYLSPILEALNVEPEDK